MLIFQPSREGSLVQNTEPSIAQGETLKVSGIKTQDEEIVDNILKGYKPGKYLQTIQDESKLSKYRRSLGKISGFPQIYSSEANLINRRPTSEQKSERDILYSAKPGTAVHKSRNIDLNHALLRKETNGSLISESRFSSKTKMNTMTMPVPMTVDKFTPYQSSLTLRHLQTSTRSKFDIQDSISNQQRNSTEEPIHDPKKEAKDARTIHELTQRVKSLTLELNDFRRERLLTMNPEAQASSGLKHPLKDEEFVGDEELVQAKKMLYGLIVDAEETVKEMKTRSDKIAFLFVSLQSMMNGNEDIRALAQKVNSFTSANNASCQLEMQLGYKTREIEKRGHQFNSLLMYYNKLKERLETLDQKYADQVKLNTQISEDNITLGKALGTEKNRSQQLEKKHEELIRRNEALTTRENPERIQDKLRRALSELNKENEGLRRDLYLKTKEVENLTEANAELEIRNNRLVTKLGIEKERHYNRINEIESGYKKKVDGFDFKKTRAAEFYSIPSVIIPGSQYDKRNLEQRGQHLEKHEVNLLADIVDHGVDQMMDHYKRIDNEEEKFETMKFVTRELISYYKFAESLVYFQALLQNIIKSNDRRIIMNHVAVELPKLFCARRVLVWLKENMTGSLFTLDENKQVHKCMIHKGMMKKVFLEKKGIFEKNLHEDSLYEHVMTKPGDSSFTQATNCLMMPIFSRTNQVIGSIEITDIQLNEWTNDVDVLFMAGYLCNFISNIMQRIIYENLLEDHHKLTDRYVGMLVELSSKKNDRKLFSRAVMKYAESILNISNIHLFFVESAAKKMTRLEKEQWVSYSLSDSVISHVADTKQTLVLPDINSFPTFNKSIDLSSMFPVYTFPILIDHEGQNFGVSLLSEEPQEGGDELESQKHVNRDDPREVIGVLQLSMKSSARGTGDFSNIGMDDFNRDDSIEQLLLEFVKIISITLNLKASSS